MDIQKENNLIQEAFNDEAHSRGFCLDQEWSDCENPYLDGDTNLAFDFFKSGWQAAIARMEVRINTLDEMLLNQGEALAQAKAQEAEKLEGCVVVPHGVLDLTRFMCKTWSEIDKFVYKNCSDIGQYPVIQGTQNQLNLSRIGEQQINANEINKGVKWLLEAPQEQSHV